MLDTKSLKLKLAPHLSYGDMSKHLPCRGSGGAIIGKMAIVRDSHDKNRPNVLCFALIYTLEKISENAIVISLFPASSQCCAVATIAN